MRAVIIRESGGLDCLEAVEMADPSPSTGQVVIRVGGCGVCYRDLIDREGKYPFMRRPVVTGHELAGEIVAVGDGVREFAVGDRVAITHRAPCGTCVECQKGEETHCFGTPVAYGITVDGGYAELCLAWESSLTRVPAGVALDEAAFMHCTAGTALRALRKQGRLAAGQTVLITGASGGVGVHAIQIAHILGARVIALTSSEAKVAPLRALGADEVIVSRDGAFQREVLNRSDGGVDVALDLVGAPTFNGALRSLKPGGRIVVVGNITVERLEVNPGYLIMRDLTVSGSSGATRAELAEVLQWVAEGKLRPIVAERRPLVEARAAQEKLTQRGVLGRQVLIP
jgi:acryloyl-coenzyme A reductase